MNTALQNAKGPAEAATSPDRGSTPHPTKEKVMNTAIHSTGMAEAPVPSIVSRRLGDIIDLLATVRYLNEAVFMAAGSIGMTDATNAIQSVSNEMESKLLAVEERLEETMEELA